MKTIRVIVLLTITAAISWAQSSKVEYQPPGGEREREEWESYQLVHRLSGMEKPGAPVIFEDYVIFTAPSDLRRVGVAFAHEHFSRVYWFRQLFTPQDPIGAPIPPGKKVPDLFIDSGLQFHVYHIPEDVKELEYRLIVSGLWITDPANPQMRRDTVSGLVWSVLPLPPRAEDWNPLRAAGPIEPLAGPRSVNFSFKGTPGETITVAGDFNGWDPFMYELKESPEGAYSINISLMPGVYQYVFFNRGQRLVDLNNPRRVYSRDGRAASELTVP